MDRRVWLQLLGVLAAARPGAAQQQPPPPAASAFTADQVTAALKLLGIEFETAQIEMMLPSLNRALRGYDALRKVDIPLDTEPAYSFHPGLPGRQPSTAKPRFQPTKPRPAAAPKNIEDLAFLSVAELAPLVKAKRVSSMDLTKM